MVVQSLVPHCPGLTPGHLLDVGYLGMVVLKRGKHIWNLLKDANLIYQS